MQIPVLIEPLAKDGFRATAGPPLPLCAEGATAEQALQNLRAALASHLQRGKQLTVVELSTPGNPWLRMAGIFDPNDPLVHDWEQEMAAHRADVEAESERPCCSTCSTPTR